LDVDQILTQHVRILKGLEALEEIAAGERPERVDSLAHRRWAFTRDMLLHFSRMESTVLAPLSVDIRPAAVESAKSASAAVARYVEMFHAHAARWKGFPPAEQWAEYRAASARFAEAVRELIDREATMIVPLLPVQPSGTPPPVSKDRYASDAWHVRGIIFDHDQKPIE
jgi:hypothetical protein